MDRPFPAYQGDDSYTFVCFSHADADVVYRELVWLRGQGCNIWYDEGITPGKEWTQELADAIEGADHFLFFVTPDAVQSKYCRDELNFARNRNKQLASVHLKQTLLTGGLELSMGSTQAILRYELSHADYLVKLQAALDLNRQAPDPPTGKLENLESGFRVGGWQVAPSRGTLTRAEEVVHLEPKVMDVLVCLARHAGEVLKRDELLDEVWPGVVVQDEVLNRSISLLRSSLKDERRDPRFIQTVPRVGYRLVAPVQPESEAPSMPHRRPSAVVLGATLTVAIVVIVAYMAGRSIEDSGLEWIPDSDIVSMAVLPFVDLAGGDDQGNFSAGLTAEIMSDLSRVEGLRVMLRARNPDEDVCAVGQRLDAATLLSGSVQRDGARLRVTFRWVNANDCYQILADSYERMLDDIFEVQHAISEAIVRRLARALGTDLTSVQPAGPPPSPEAYQPFLLGRHNLILGRYDLEHRGEESIRRSIKLFQDAIQRDADLAEAYLSLAEAYMLLPSYADTLANDQEPMNSALAALERVEELDGNSNRTYAARAFIHTLNLEWIEAERLFRAAIALQPNDANLRHRYSQFLGRVGYTDRSLGQAKLARDLDDVSPVLKSRLATAYVGAGYNDLAAEQFALARAAGMVSAVNVGSGLVLLYRQKKFEEMVRLISALQNEKGLSTKWVAAVVEALQHPDDAEANRLGMAEFAQAAEAGDLYPRLHWGALILLRQPQLALEITDQLIQDQSRHIADVMEFLFAAEAAVVRVHPLFAGIIRQVKLDLFWDIHGWPKVCERIDGVISCH